MRGARIICPALAFAVLWLALANSSLASATEFKVIVHPSNPATMVERTWLRDAFLKKVITWRHGPMIQPVEVAAPQKFRELFSKAVLQKTHAALRAYWVQRIFSGTGLPPHEVRSPTEAIAYVLQHPGAVAYLPMDVDPAGAKVIDLR